MSDFTEIEKQYREGTLKPGYVTTGILIDIIEKQRDVALMQFRRIEDCIYEPDKITIHIDHGRKDITKLTEE